MDEKREGGNESRVLVSTSEFAYQRIWRSVILAGSNNVHSGV